ncbi:MAG: FG-GAP repeat protein [Pirellulales bacterium]|nr:FG-GAP repeat protein [Pirellulales bacterium]
MPFQQSFRRIFQRASRSTFSVAKRRKRNWAGFEQLETRKLLTDATGDFNGDGFDDLAVGSPFDNVAGKADSGSVQILYGSVPGLASDNNRRFTLESNGLQGSAVGGEHFGAALAVGDFDGDGYDDLAIGAPNESVGGIDAGAVHILYGSRFGLRTTDNQIFHQDKSGINGNAADGDQFGWALASGDFNRDGRDDLAVGIPGEDVSAMNNAGAVSIIYGRKSGLTAHGDQLWNQASPGVDGNPDVDDQFGYALAAGNFNADASDDLAIGIIGETVSGLDNAGEVYIMYGRKNSGLSEIGDQRRNSQQTKTSVAADDGAFANGQFGFALATGDFNDDSHADLAVGAPGEEGTNNNIAGGAVHVYYGGGGGLKTSDHQKWDKGVAGIAELPDADDRFGSALTVGQINRNRPHDLIIGIPGNTISTTSGAGSIRVLFGTATGLAPTGTVSMTQSSAAGLGTNQTDDFFGKALAVGDFNGDELYDVAVGTPGDQTSLGVKSGGVYVFYATTNTLGTTGAQLWLPGAGGLTNSANDGDQFGGALA